MRNREPDPRKLSGGRGWCLALGLLAACSSAPEAGGPEAPTTAAPPPPVVITRLQVEDSTPPDFQVAPATDLDGLVRRRLEAAGFTLAEKAPENGHRITLEVRLARGLTAGEGFMPAKAERPAGTRARAVWLVEGRAKAPGQPTAQYFFLEGADEAPAEADPLPGLARHTEKALDPIVQGLKARTSVMGLAAEVLVPRLADADPAIRLAVVDQLAAQRSNAAVQALIDRAKVEQDREVLLRLIGALSEIGDDRAAQALIGLANPRDREVLRAVVDALSVVGGERVADFFDILASHDAPDVREMVEDARTRLARKSEKAEKAGPGGKAEAAEPPGAAPGSAP